MVVKTKYAASHIAYNLMNSTIVFIYTKTREIRI